MTKETWYRYLGTNGVINSPVHLEDIYYIRLVMLRPSVGKLLTNGIDIRTSALVAEEEADKWYEINE